MKKKWIAVLALAGLLFAMNAYAEESAVQPEETATAQTVAATEETTAPEETAAPEETVEPENPHELTTQSRWFISQSLHIRRRKVTYYDNVYAYNHGKYVLTPFASDVPPEYIVEDENGTYAVAPIVLDITDAMRERLYGGDYGETAMLYGQYCERRANSKGNYGFTGIHEGIDFVLEPGAQLHAILSGEVTRAGDSNGTVGIYNAEYDVTLLYLHCEKISVKRGDVLEAGDPIAVEGNKNSGSDYTHVEMRSGRHTSSSPYRDVVLTSDCPYAVMQAALGVTESGRQPVTEAAVRRAQQMREEAEAAARAAAEAEAAAQAEEEQEAEPEIVLIDELPGTRSGYGFGDDTAEPQETPAEPQETPAEPAPEATLPPANP